MRSGSLLALLWGSFPWGRCCRLPFWWHCWDEKGKIGSWGMVAWTQSAEAVNIDDKAMKRWSHEVMKQNFHTRQWIYPLILTNILHMHSMALDVPESWFQHLGISGLASDSVSSRHAFPQLSLSELTCATLLHYTHFQDCLGVPSRFYIMHTLSTWWELCLDHLCG